MSDEWLFRALTGTIAVSLMGLAAIFLASFRMPPKGEPRQLAYLGMVSGAGFLGMTAYLFALLAMRSVRGTLNPLWYTPEAYTLFGIQAVMGLIFWAFTAFCLRINIYDRRHYEQVVDKPVDERPESVDNP